MQRPIVADNRTMRLPLASQLAAAFAVPIVALVLVAGSASLGFVQLHSAKQELAAKYELRGKVHDITLRGHRDAFGGPRLCPDRQAVFSETT
jgi:hypothetical protein